MFEGQTHLFFIQFLHTLVKLQDVSGAEWDGVSYSAMEWNQVRNVLKFNLRFRFIKFQRPSYGD
jgi:hypothetical protein